MSREGRAVAKLDLSAVLRSIVAGLLDNWLALLLFGLAVFLPVGLMTTLIPVDDFEFDRLDDRQALEAFAVGIAAGLISLVGTVLYSGVISGAVSAHREGRDRSLADIARSLPYGRLIGADFALILLVAIGFVLLIVPGFTFLVWFALVAPAIEIEDRSVASGLRRSYELVRGNFWRAAVLVWPAFLIQGALEGAGESIANDLLGDGWVSEWLGTAAGGLLAGPTFALVVVILFLELRDLDA